MNPSDPIAIAQTITLMNLLNETESEGAITLEGLLFALALVVCHIAAIRVYEAITDRIMNDLLVIVLIAMTGIIATLIPIMGWCIIATW